jgi:hypothetical protein
MFFSVLLLINFENPNVIGIGSLPESIPTTNLLLAGQVLRPGDWIQVVDFNQYFVTGNLMMTLPCNSAGMPSVVPVGGDIDLSIHHTYLSQIPISIINHASNNGTSCMYNATINAIDLVCSPSPNLDTNEAYNTCPSASTPMPPRVTTVGLLNTGEKNVVFRTGNSVVFTLTGVAGDISQHLNQYGHPSNLPTHDPDYHGGAKTFEDLMGTSAIVVGSGGSGNDTSDSDNDGVSNAFDVCPNDFDPHNQANHSTLDIDNDGLTFGCDTKDQELYINVQDVVNSPDPSSLDPSGYLSNLVSHNGVSGFGPVTGDADGDGFLDGVDSCLKWDLLDKSTGLPLNVDGDGTTFSCEVADEIANSFTAP